ncbi:MAG: cobaltochelatase subunit CobN, partial [Planctomycetota bacterium]
MIPLILGSGAAGRTSPLLRAAFCLAALLPLAPFQEAQRGEAPPAREKAPFLFLGWWDRAQPALLRAARAEGALIETAGIHDPALKTVPLRGRKAVLIGQIGFEEAHALKARIEAIEPTERPDFLLAVDRESHAELLQNGLARRDPAVQARCFPPGEKNYRAFFRLLAIRYLGAPGEPPPASPPLRSGLYHPDAPAIFADLEAFRAWEKEQDRPAGPTAALQVQGDYLHLGDHAVIDALIRGLQAEGLRVVTFFGSGDFLRETAAALKPDLLLTGRHSGIEDERRRKGGVPTLLEQLDVPYLGPISMLSQTWEEWRADPRGVRETAALVTPRELHGIFEPGLVGGVAADERGLKIHTPNEELLRRFCARAAAWVRLREKSNAEKRIAVLYYHRYLGKGDVGRSRSASGMFLDTHASLLAFGKALEARGYALEDFPDTVEELVKAMQAKGRIIPSWAPGELARFVAEGDPVLLPLEDYLRWYREEIPESARRRIEAVFGPPPGRFMVWRQGERSWFVLPVLRFGNLLLAPQPDRGDIQDAALIHDRRTPPPHDYLAFYLWLRHGFHADAVVHFGTHGSEIYLPGKDVGLAAGDFPPLCLGDLPNLNPWILDNLGEAIIAKRRANALLVDHLPPPAARAGLDPERRALLEELERFPGISDSAVREEARRGLSETIRRLGLAPLVAGGGELLEDARLEKTAGELRALSGEQTTLGLHALGQGLRGDRLQGYLDAILGANPRLKEDPAKGAALRGGLSDCSAELGNLLDGLEGRFVPPGPGPAPDRNPEALPTGRNLYGIDPGVVPTREAWVVAGKLVSGILAAEEARTGLPARQVAFNLSGMETFRDYGVMEAEILQLLGVRPVRNAGGRIVDLELVPRDELGRPRCDVFVALGAIYLTTFPDLARMLDRAVRLAAAAEGEDNPVRTRTLELAGVLEDGGVPPERARLRAASRLFGTAPGGGGFRLEYLFPRSGEWGEAADLFRAYRLNASYLYSQEIWGRPLEELYEKAIGGAQAVVTTWGSRMTSPLSNHHQVEGTGGLSLAVEQVTGRSPQAYVGDLRHPKGPRAASLDEILRQRLGVELLDPAWARAQMEHPFGGAGQVAELVRNAFGWRALRKTAMPPEAFSAIADFYVDDVRGLGLREWFDKNNPFAFQTITALLLESARRKFWTPSRARLRKLARLYAESVARHGYNQGAVEGGNQKLQELVAVLLEEGGEKKLEEDYRARVAAAEEPPAPAESPVVGRTVSEEPPLPPGRPAPPKPRPSPRPGLPGGAPVLLAAAAALF